MSIDNDPIQSREHSLLRKATAIGVIAAGTLGGGALIGNQIHEHRTKSAMTETIDTIDVSIEPGEGVSNAVCTGLGELAASNSDVNISDVNCIYTGQEIGGVVQPYDQINVSLVEDGNGKVSLIATEIDN